MNIGKKHFGSLAMIAVGVILLLSPSFITLSLTQPPVFSDDFENQNFVLWSNQFASSGETVSITTGAYHGTYCARFSCDGSETREYAYIEKTLDTGYSELYVAIRFQRSSIFENEYVLSLYGSDTVASVLLRDELGGVRVWYRDDNDTDYYANLNTDTVPSAGIWHYAEIHARVGATNGLVSLTLDSTTISTSATLDNDGVGAITKIRVGSYGSMYEPSLVAHTTLIDTVVVATEPIDGDIPEQEEPPTQYTLTVSSTPISSISYTVQKGTTQKVATTGTPVSLETGDWLVTLPQTTSQLGTNYEFLEWSDELANNVRTVTIADSDVSLSASYQEVIPTATSGTLEVHVTIDSVEIAGVEITILETEDSSITSESGATFSLEPNTYNVKATLASQNMEETKQATIAESQTTTVNFNWVTSGEPEPTEPGEPTQPTPTPTPTIPALNFQQVIVQALGGGLIVVGTLNLRKKR